VAQENGDIRKIEEAVEAMTKAMDDNYVPKEGRFMLTADGYIRIPPNPEKLDSPNPKAAFGAAKAPFFGVPACALAWLGCVMAGGAYKYGLYNFRDTEIAASTYHDAILRHLFLYFDGEDIDPESNAPHLAHIMACCALMLDATENGMLIDDRNETGVLRDVLKRSAEAFTDFKEEYDKG